MKNKLKSENIKTGETFEGSMGDSHQILEENAVNAPVKDVLWNAQEIQTDGVKLEDPGEGGAVILRHFFFKAIPSPYKPTKEQIVSHFKRVIETTLWTDGLRPREDGRVEVHTKGYLKKTGAKALYEKLVKEKADFVIQVMAEPKKGILLNERPTVL